MTQPDVGLDQEDNGLASQATIAIDPLSFFQYAAGHEDRWRELEGRSIKHCTFGLGTIRKIDGEYLSVDLPERQGKKQLTEFGLDSFRRGFFQNLQVDAALQEKILAAAASPELPPPPEPLEAEANKEPVKKKRKSPQTTKATKKSES